jgi:hypothetical protein
MLLQQLEVVSGLATAQQRTRIRIGRLNTSVIKPDMPLHADSGCHTGGRELSGRSALVEIERE